MGRLASPFRGSRECALSAMIRPNGTATRLTQRSSSLSGLTLMYTMKRPKYARNTTLSRRASLGGQLKRG